jgi:hypothetical protein
MPENSANRPRHSTLSFLDREYFHMESESSPRPKCRISIQLPLKGSHEVVYFVTEPDIQNAKDTR